MGASTHGSRDHEWAARSPDLTVVDFALWPFGASLQTHLQCMYVQYIKYINTSENEIYINLVVKCILNEFI